MRRRFTKQIHPLHQTDYCLDIARCTCHPRCPQLCIHTKIHGLINHFCRAAGVQQQQSCTEEQLHNHVMTCTLSPQLGKVWRIRPSSAPFLAFCQERRCKDEQAMRTTVQSRFAHSAKPLPTLGLLRQQLLPLPHNPTVQSRRNSARLLELTLPIECRLYRTAALLQYLKLFALTKSSKTTTYPWHGRAAKKRLLRAITTCI